MLSDNRWPDVDTESRKQTMPKGFFSSSVTKQPQSVVPLCGACGLHKTCESPKMPVMGEGELGVLIVAEAPGKTEDEENEQLIGESGQLLRKKLSIIGIDLERDCWLTYSLICHLPKNRKPTNTEIEYCRPNVLNAIKELNPKVIVPLGGSAVQSVVGHLWKEDTGAISRWVGFRIPNHKPNAWICPTYHPSHLLKMKRDSPDQFEVLDIHFVHNLESAFNKKTRPWEEIPRWEDEVKIVMEDEEATKIIQQITRRGGKGAIAFDYETDRLKPDATDSSIASCSVTWGIDEPERTIAYPWRGSSIEATRELLRSPIPKIAANMKFEDRWTRKVLGHRVRNLVWDTMLASHWSDSRPNICGLKFQAYVQLGQTSYDDQVSGYLKSSGTRTVNKINQADMRMLLKYNGMDSLLEFRLAIEQMKQSGYKRPW